MEPRTMDPNVDLGGSTAGATDHRPNLGSLDYKAMQKMNETYHFKNDSKMSIQAGQLQ